MKKLEGNKLFKIQNIQHVEEITCFTKINRESKAEKHNINIHNQYTVHTHGIHN